MDPERIDFSPLDPSKDELRWERMVRNVTARATQRRGVLDQVSRWALPAVAVAALLAVLAWVPALTRGASTQGTSSSADAVVVFSEFAATGSSSDVANWYFTQEESR